MLSAYRVLDLTDYRGNLAGLLLAALGAEVIAIEPPGGSDSRRMGPFGILPSHLAGRIFGPSHRVR